MTNTMTRLGVLLYLLGIGANTEAAVYSIDLPELTGELETHQGDGTSRTAEFDFGMHFSSVDSVYIDVKIADELPGTYTSDNGATHQPFDLQLILGTMAEEPTQGNYATKLINDNYYTHRMHFYNALPVIDFYTTFYDGRGMLRLDSQIGFITIGFRPPPEVVSPATGNLVDARLVVVGDAIPEPSSVSMGLATMLACGCSGRRRRR